MKIYDPYTDSWFDRDTGVKIDEPRNDYDPRIFRDLVLVVRCKDCKHSKDTGDYQDTYFCTSRTHAQDFLVHSLDYCSYGERIEE